MESESLVKTTYGFYHMKIVVGLLIGDTWELEVILLQYLESRL